MKSKKFSFIMAILACFLALALVLNAGCSSTTDNEGDTGTPVSIVITDMAGREVSVQAPVESIVLASARHLHEFAAVGGAEVIDKIVGWGSDLKLYDQDTYLASLAGRSAGLLDLRYKITGDELANALSTGFARLFNVEWGVTGGRFSCHLKEVVK